MKEGLHLIMDALCEVEGVSVISSEEEIRGVILQLVALLDMQLLLDPVVCTVPTDENKLEVCDDSGGLTAFCVITTSHISIHTWPLEQRMSLDVYSCKNFDAENAVRFLVKALRLKRWKTTVLERNSVL